MTVEGRAVASGLFGSALVALTLLAMLLLNGLWSQPLSHPREFYSHDNYAAGLRAADALNARPDGRLEQHPFHWLAAPAVRVLGRDFRALGAVSAAWYVLLTIAAGLLGRIVLGRGRGWIVALLIAVAPGVVGLSRVYDTYGALLCCQMLCAALAIIACRRGSVLAALSASAVLYAGMRLQLEPTNAVMLLIGCAGTMALSGWESIKGREAETSMRRVARYVCAALLTLVALGGLAWAASRVLGSSYYLAQIASHADEGGSALQRVLRFPLYYPLLLTLNLAGPLCVPAALLGLVLLLRSKHAGRWQALVLLAAPLLALSLITKKQENYAVVLLPGLALAGAALIARLRSPWRGPTLALIAGLSAVWIVWGSAARGQNNLCGTLVGPMFDQTCWSVCVPAQDYPEVALLRLDVRTAARKIENMPGPLGAVYLLTDNTLLARPAEFMLLCELPGYPVHNLWTAGRFKLPGERDLIACFEAEPFAADAGPAFYRGHFQRNPSIPQTDEYWENLIGSGVLKTADRGERFLLLRR
ncbi:MAG: hypothetical protein P9M14_14345 [Candidatus Alcyoniella australis]|nr:hypothetical protein [Candidatus Alcyoniella australis]